jgi:hypothetical protein
MIWYHGTPLNFEHFDDKFIGVGNDQLGSGFYFTDDIDTARMHAAKERDGDVLPTVLFVELAIHAPVPEEGGVTRKQIADLLKAAPQYEEALTNFGDVSWEGENKVLGMAADAYYNIAKADTLRALYTISNDFYQGDEALFLRKASEFTGFDGVVRTTNGETHAVAWFPEQITITDRQLLDFSRGTKL